MTPELTRSARSLRVPRREPGPTGTPRSPPWTGSAAWTCAAPATPSSASRREHAIRAEHAAPAATSPQAAATPTSSPSAAPNPARQPPSQGTRNGFARRSPSPTQQTRLQASHCKIFRRNQSLPAHPMPLGRSPSPNSTSTSLQARRERDAILQPPNPEITPADPILELGRTAAAQADFEADPG